MGRKRIEHQVDGTGEELKRCYMCQQWLPLGQYYKDKTKWDDLCCGCCSCMGEYRETHKNEKRELHLKHDFGLSLEDYSRVFTSQGGVCAICGSSPNGMALAVDHNHETGEVRGLLCSNCNVAIGLMKDDPGLLQKAIDYVRMYSGTEVIVE